MSGVARRQRGVGMVGAMAWLGLAVLLLTVGFRLAPSYIDYLTVKSAMNATSEDQELKGKGRLEVMSSLGRRLEVNNIRGLPADAFSVEPDGSGRQLVAAYEVRVPVLFNIDAVLSFDHRAPLPRQ